LNKALDNVRAEEGSRMKREAALSLQKIALVAAPQQ
jgi:hypothetical protein